MKPVTLEWIEKAEGDFVVANQIMRRRKQRIFDAACFHAQQTAEKYLKARMVEDGIQFPKTHDCDVLFNLLLPKYPLWSVHLKQAKALTQYAVNFRYPGDNAVLAEAKAAMQYGRAIRTEVRASFGLK